ILGSLIESGFEIIQTSSQPRIVLAQLLHPKCDQLCRKQFCQRRGDRLQQGTASNEVQVFVYREACRRKNTFAGANLRWIEPRGLRYFNPALKPPFTGSVAIVVDDPF